MAAVRCMFNAADGVEGSSLVTGGRGQWRRDRYSGFRRAGPLVYPRRPGVPDGGLDVDVPLDRRLGAIV